MAVTVVGYEKLTGLSAAKALASPLAAAPVHGQQTIQAIIMAEVADVRWRADGIAPTAAIGQPLMVGMELDYDGDLSKFQVIEVTAGAALSVTYYYGADQ